jgi:hypothetical protein
LARSRPRTTVRPSARSSSRRGRRYSDHALASRGRDYPTDHQHSSKRWLFFEAADREAAEALIPALVPKGGYVGYELSAILSLTPAVAAAA